MKRIAKEFRDIVSLSPPLEQTHCSAPEALVTAAVTSEDSDSSEGNSVYSDGALTWDRQLKQTQINLLVAGQMTTLGDASSSQIRGTTTPLSGPPGASTI